MTEIRVEDSIEEAKIPDIHNVVIDSFLSKNLALDENGIERWNKFLKKIGCENYRED